MIRPSHVRPFRTPTPTRRRGTAAGDGMDSGGTGDPARADAARLLGLNGLDRFTVQDVRRDGESLVVLYTTSQAAFVATLRRGLIDELRVIGQPERAA